MRKQIALPHDFQYHKSRTSQKIILRAEAVHGSSTGKKSGDRAGTTHEERELVF